MERLKIFLSHAWKDKDLDTFKQLDNALREHYEVWVDVHGIDFGENIRDKVKKGIEACDVFIVLWSENAQESKDVRFETETALHLKKKILPCLISVCDENKLGYLAGLKFFDLVKYNVSLVWVLLNGILIKEQLNKLRNNRPDLRQQLDKMKEQMSATQFSMAEVSHTMYRQIGGLSGKNSTSYIKGMMNGLMKMAESEGDKGKMEKLAAFAKGVSDLTEHHLADFDAMNYVKLIELLETIDPDGSVNQLAAFKNFLVSQNKG